MRQECIRVGRSGAEDGGEEETRGASVKREVCSACSSMLEP